MKCKNSKQFPGNGDYKFAFKILVDVFSSTTGKESCIWMHMVYIESLYFQCHLVFIPILLQIQYVDA